MSPGSARKKKGIGSDIRVERINLNHSSMGGEGLGPCIVPSVRQKALRKMISNPHLIRLRYCTS